MSKKAIEWLEKAKLCVTKPTTLVDTVYYCINQALAELQKQSPGISDIAIPCPDECGGILEVKEFIDRPTCNECGRVFVLCKEGKQPPEGELAKEINELCRLLDTSIIDVIEPFATWFEDLKTYAKQAAARLDQQAEENKSQAAEIKRLKHLASDVQKTNERLFEEIKRLKKQVGDLNAKAVRKVLNQRGPFTGKS